MGRVGSRSSRRETGYQWSLHENLVEEEAFSCSNCSLISWASCVWGVDGGAATFRGGRNLGFLAIWWRRKGVLGIWGNGVVLFVCENRVDVVGVEKIDDDEAIFR